MNDRLALLVLAGGRSKRLGEIKPLVEINNEPMIKKVVKEVSAITSEVIISCREGRGKLEAIFPDARIHRDDFEEEGPLVGLMSSLPSIRREYVAVVPCDSPLIKLEVLELLFEEAKEHSGAIPRWPNGYLEPLTAVYRVEELVDATKSTWREGNMKLTKVIDKLEDVNFVSTENIKSVDGKLESFININTQEDLEKNFR